MRIRGYEDYEILKDGTIISHKKKRPRILNWRLSHDGYARVSLSRNGNPKEFKVHRLVIEHFGNGEKKETINHIDGNKLNNHIDNLEWATREENMRHAYKLKLKKPADGVRNGNSVLSEEEVKYIRENYKPHSKEYGMIALAEKFNVSISTINKCVGRRSYKNV